METITYQHQPENWLYEIKQKGNSQTCYVMVQNVKVSFYIYFNEKQRMRKIPFITTKLLLV